jgi:hypothetical protein
LISKTEITLGASTSNSDVPMVDVQEAKVDIPTLSGTHTGGFTTVTTDLLTVEIDVDAPKVISVLLTMLPLASVVRVICHLSHKMKTVKKIAMPRNNF